MNLIKRMRAVYEDADPLDHRIVVERDVILGWMNEITTDKRKLRQHMEWLTNRLINRYGENKNVDWAHKTRRLLKDE